MRIRGEVSVGNQLAPVEVEAAGSLVRVTDPRPNTTLCFEGRRNLSWRDRMVNWLRLAVGSGSPIRCAFADVRLDRSEDGLFLIVNPGWPWGEPLRVSIAENDCRILDEWNKGFLNHLDGKSVRCSVIEGGFAIWHAGSGTVLLTIQWDDVRAVRAFKRDLFAHDMICLAFQLTDKSWVEIWEESEGFVAVIQKMAQVLPGIPANWYMDIMVPAFAAMDTLLYRRDDAHGHCPHCPRCQYDLTGNISGVCPECGDRI